jgi:sulfite oxidase
MGMWGKRDDMIVHQTDPYNAEPPRGALAEAPITAVDAFYARNHGPIPAVDPEAWRLVVDGMVGRPLSLSLAELQESFTERQVVATLQCAGNRRAGLLAFGDIPDEEPWGPGATSTARWSGVRLGDVLQAGGIQAGAAHVAFTAPDVSPLATPPQPYGGSVPRAKALAPETLLVWGMNDEPLPAVHGGPVRMIVPGYVGARSVKWVERVTAQARPSDNYFQATAYRLLPAEADPDQAGPGDGLSLGPLAVNADILVPDEGGKVAGGATTVKGYAFAGGDRAIARVDVSPDGGRTWQQADLDDQTSPWAWCHWQAAVDLPSGVTEIVARAWDCAANVQPESGRHLWNPKGYVNNSWARVTVSH